MYVTIVIIRLCNIYMFIVHKVHTLFVLKSEQIWTPEQIWTWIGSSDTSFWSFTLILILLVLDVTVLAWGSGFVDNFRTMELLCCLCVLKRFVRFVSFMLVSCFKLALLMVALMTVSPISLSKLTSLGCSLFDNEIYFDTRTP